MILEKELTYADLIIPLPLAQLFTYIIPDDLISSCYPGVRAIISFGKKKIYTGVIRNIHTHTPSYQTKEIISILDDKPIISDLQFKLWEWISEYYMCSIGDVYKAALPSGLKLESETIITIHENPDTSNIKEKEELLIGLLIRNNNLPISKINKDVDFNVYPIIKRLLDKGIVSAEERIKKKYKPKYEDYITINEDFNNKKDIQKIQDKLNRAKKQKQLFEAFIEITGFRSEIPKSELLKKSTFSSSVLKGLLDKGILISEKKEISRLNYNYKIADELTILNNAQKTALGSIYEQFKEKNVVLLHGVTSSGKTEIYIQLIQEQLSKGKQVLYLLPEIALTAQITNRLTKVFGDQLGIYHSKFSDNERVEVWKKLREKDPDKRYNVILGVRSSVFLPFSNLGLIIVDEEHENTYKQFNPAPRYNARDVSVILAQIHHSKVLLGTATPSIESYYNAKTEKYGLVELFSRYMDIKLPEIVIDDTREARRKLQMKSLFAPKMLSEIKQALENNEQIILFQNRRGFSSYIECEQCGNIPKCENCDVSLTYHKFTNNLICHYCGYTEYAQKKCKSCSSESMINRGFGTQKIEDEIHTLFPGVKTARMDMDTTSNKKSYQKIIYDFESGNTDILIGTQMISKGLDFDNVSLVGIMNADNMLNFPDFRSFERSYQLMAQVSGRAGRKKKQGRVIIQTSEKDHPIIINVIDNNFIGMFSNQLVLRKQFKYPPYYRLIRISIKHKQKYIVDGASEYLAKELRKTFGRRLLGPEYPVISRIKTWYIKQILLKFEKNIANRQAKDHIYKAFENVNTNEKYKYVQFVVDVDPM